MSAHVTRASKDVGGHPGLKPYFNLIEDLRSSAKSFKVISRPKIDSRISMNKTNRMESDILKAEEHRLS